MLHYTFTNKCLSIDSKAIHMNIYNRKCKINIDCYFYLIENMGNHHYYSREGVNLNGQT